MSIILNIETATKNCSVSLANDGVMLALIELNEEQLEEIEILIDKLEDDEDVQAVYTNIA